MADLVEIPNDGMRAESRSGRLTAGWAAVIITLLVQSLLLAWYLGRIDERIQNLQSDVLQLKYEIHR